MDIIIIKGHTIIIQILMDIIIRVDRSTRGTLNPRSLKLKDVIRSMKKNVFNRHIIMCIQSGKDVIMVDPQES